MNITDVYLKLKNEYMRSIGGAFFLSDNPPKQSFTLSETSDGLPNEFVNVMSSKLSNGTFGTKVIRVSEETGDMDSFTILFGRDGEPKVMQSDELTRIRCGLMAALSIDLYFGGEVGKTIGFTGREAKRVGFIGGGRTNLSTAMVLNEVFGCKNFVIAGSESNPYPALLDEFSKFGGASVTTREWGFRQLRECDVVISCTNATSRDSAIEFDELSGPQLFIAQDGGYIFGQSFRRECHSFSDYPSQILAHVDSEFPWDEEKPSFMSPLTKLRESKLGSSDFKLTKPSSVYLYGMALADMVIAEHASGESE